MQNPSNSATFFSFLITVLTLIGFAIGPGHVWGFPYMMGSYGGSAFLLLFVLFMCLIATRPDYSAGLAASKVQYGVALALLLVSLYVIGGGLRRGVERVSQAVVLFFFLVAIYLIYVVLSLPGAVQAMAKFLQTDFPVSGTRKSSSPWGSAFFPRPGRLGCAVLGQAQRR